MNEGESAHIAEILKSKFKYQNSKMSEADLIIVNSCSVRQGSEDKVYGLGQKIIPIKSQRPKANGQKPYVILTGCMVGSTKGERTRYSLSKLQKKLSFVDEFLTYDELLNQLDASYKGEAVGGIYMLPISQGCDNFCTYCVVPYSRGKEISRDLEEIVCEAEKAAEAGYREIMLLGQNVNSYNNQEVKTNNQEIEEKRELPFSKLLKRIHAIDGVRKISFLTLNPYDINDELVQTLALPKIDKHIHLPMQSGDNDVLKRMNRKNTREQYLQIIEKIKKVIPEATFGTDIIVGFPGETRQAFENTLNLVKKVGFKQIFIGVFSQREGTAAAKMGDTVPLAEKKRRHKELTSVWQNSKLT